MFFYFNGYFAFSAQYLVKGRKRKKNISDAKTELADLQHRSKRNNLKKWQKKAEQSDYLSHLKTNERRALIRS